MLFIVNLLMTSTLTFLWWKAGAGNAFIFSLIFFVIPYMAFAMIGYVHNRALSSRQWGFLTYQVFLIFVAALVRSPFGLALASARQNAERVEAVGISPYRLRLVAFVISGAVTGLAGALFADLNRFISPTMFSWQTSGEIMVFIILGGVGRLFGPVVGAGLFILLEHLLGGLSEYWMIYLGALLLFVVLFARGGLIGALTKHEGSSDD